MNRLSKEEQIRVVACLVEGNSLRATTRMKGTHRSAIQKLLVALHFMHYNFARIHQTLRCTPAMEARVSNHVWSLEEIVNLLD